MPAPPARKTDQSGSVDRIILSPAVRDWLIARRRCGTGSGMWTSSCIRRPSCRSLFAPKYIEISALKYSMSLLVPVLFVIVCFSLCLFPTVMKVINYVREFFNSRGFLEVETPILSHSVGKAKTLFPRERERERLYVEFM
jgi:hypothetical protein